MPGNSTTNSWRFPPNTREVQFDEKWSFVAKKQEHCDPEDPADDHKGDWWDHVAYDPESRLVMAVVPGARNAENVEELVDEVKDRTGGRLMEFFGTLAAVVAALARSQVSRSINVSFLERQNGTDRHHNARKVRKTYTFSKDWRVHGAITYFSMYRYNLCWTIRTLTERDKQGRIRKRTPAMAAGLADHVWSMREWITYPSMQRR